MDAVGVFLLLLCAILFDHWWVPKIVADNQSELAAPDQFAVS
jgi:hypothetical protein